ncbi:MAG TPA: amino acid ABC transporter substrate-binding protein [Deltaproteobacteria bacterium]|nr:amino acid ABC transporter substrate-binding protein [Deltaproteobacteria bacterium]
MIVKKPARLYLLSFLFGFVVFVLIFCCSREHKEVSQPDDSLKTPVQILVLASDPAKNGSAPEKELEGVLLAHALMPVVANTPIELSVHDSSERDVGNILSELMADDHLAGIIICGSDFNDVPYPHDASCGVPVVDLTWVRVFPDEQMGNCLVYSPAPSLQEQAEAAAVFLSSSLKIRKVAILVDDRLRASVMLASLFASQMISAGGTIVELLSIGQEEMHSGSLDRILRSKPEALFLPDSPGFTQKALSLLAESDLQLRVVVSNVEDEEVLLESALVMSESVYLITGYHADAVQTESAQVFLREFRKQHARRLPSARVARGAEAYFFLADHISRQELFRKPSTGDKMLQEDKRTVGMLGIDDQEGIQKSLYVGRVRPRFMRTTILEYVETIKPAVLDSGGDIRAQ